jgi:tripartite ATP-independent transporter DctP family solute receptor
MKENVGMKRYLGIAACVLLLVAIVPLGASGNGEEEVYTINCGTSIAAGTPKEASVDIAYVETFGEYVEKLSDGAIDFELYYGNSLGSDGDVCAGVSNGTIEFYIGDITTTSPFYKPSLLFSIPGAIASLEEASNLFASEWGQAYFDDCAAKTNIRILSAVGKGFRNFTTVKYSLKTVDDINGLTLRVLNNPLFIQMVESLGANPVPIDISELYTALQNGIVDGHENSVPNILQDKTYELEKYLVLDAHTGSYLCGMISESFLNSLPEHLQQAVFEADEIAREFATQTANDILTKGIIELRNNGVEIYEPSAEELEAWHSAYKEDCMELAKKEIGEDIVDDFVQAVALYGGN